MRSDERGRAQGRGPQPGQRLCTPEMIVFLVQPQDENTTLNIPSPRTAFTHRCASPRMEQEDGLEGRGEFYFCTETPVHAAEQEGGFLVGFSSVFFLHGKHLPFGTTARCGLRCRHGVVLEVHLCFSSPEYQTSLLNPPIKHKAHKNKKTNTPAGDPQTQQLHQIQAPMLYGARRLSAEAHARPSAL